MQSTTFAQYRVLFYTADGAKSYYVSDLLQAQEAADEILATRPDVTPISISRRQVSKWERMSEIERSEVER